MRIIDLWRTAANERPLVALKGCKEIIHVLIWMERRELLNKIAGIYPYFYQSANNETHFKINIEYYRGDTVSGIDLLIRSETCAIYSIYEESDYVGSIESLDQLYENLLKKIEAFKHAAQSTTTPAFSSKTI